MVFAIITRFIDDETANVSSLIAARQNRVRQTFTLAERHVTRPVILRRRPDVFLWFPSLK